MPVDRHEIPNFVAGARWKGYDTGPGVSKGRQVAAGVRQLILPGRVAATTVGVSAGKDLILYERFTLGYPATLESVVVEVTGAGTAGSGIKCALTLADVDWQPIGARLWTNNGSPFAFDTTGVKTASGIGLVLPPGRYLFCFVHSSTTGHVLRRFMGGVPGGAYRAAISATPFYPSSWRTAGNPWYATGIPDPVPAPDTAGSGGVGDGLSTAFDLSAVAA